MHSTNVLQSILIGTAGGAGAGLTVWLVQLVREKHLLRRDTLAVIEWLRRNTADDDGPRFRSTRAIASWTNLTEVSRPVHLQRGQADLPLHGRPGGRMESS